jgi:serine protease
MTLLKRLTLAVGGLALIAACDQREERVDRATGLYDSVREQVAEDVLGQDVARSPMERASVEARALGGSTLLPMPELQPASVPNNARFVVGSIIAKPAAIEVIEAIEAAEPESLSAVPLVRDEPVFEAAPMPAPGQPRSAPAPAPPDIATSLPVIEIPEAAKRGIAKKMQGKRAAGVKLDRIELPGLEEIEKREFKELRELKIDPPQAREFEAMPRAMRRVPALPQAPRQALKVERRLAMSSPKLQVQEAARAKMLTTMEKYGLEGRVQPLDRGGQMKLSIRGDLIDPTRFQGEAGEAMEMEDLFVLDTRESCPTDLPYEEIRKNPKLATICVVEELQQTGEFEYVEKDYVFEHQFARKPKDEDIAGPGGVSGASTLLPNDPLFGLQWHYASFGSEEGNSPGGAGFVDFWSSQSILGSREVVVAVVDTGLDLDHPDIVRSENVAQGYDFVSDPIVANDGDGRDADPDDPGDLCDPRKGDEDTFHGTHVAGTIGAALTNNGSGIAGGAWNVTIVPVRAMGRCGGQLSDINDSIRWSAGLIPVITDEDEEIWNDNPADIINLSIGLPAQCPPSLQDAIDSVVERGAIVVSAAGNARIPTSFYAPGGCRNVISVAAGDARGQIAPYSNYGVEVDILAPGGDLTRDDNGDKFPDGVLSTRPDRDCVDPVTGEQQSECFYAFEQGTSMAAPHVSAALALIMAKYPDASPEEVRQYLLAATEPREDNQCAGSCLLYPGATKIPGTDNLCARPCGAGLLNLARLPDEG